MKEYLLYLIVLILLITAWIAPERTTPIKQNTEVVQ